MTPTANEYAEWHVRLLRRLTVIVDDRWAYSIRLASVRAVQAMLPPENPLRKENPEDLLDRILQPWDVRLYLVGGRRVTRRVTRPPASLRDVWS